MDLEPTILAVPLSDTYSLVSVNDPDTMTDEPMWPTDEEMHGADADQLSVEASIGVLAENGACWHQIVGATPKLMYFVRVGPCLCPPGNHHPHGSLQDTDKLDTPKDVSAHQ